MRQEFRQEYHTASKRSHHHALVVGLGLFIVSSMTFLQLTPQLETYASYSPTWCSDNSGAIDIPLSECEALADLYVATDGDNWTNNSDWFSGTTICNAWYGVACGGSNIQGITLTGNNLSGTLSESMGNFVTLDNLALFNNMLQGTIPSSLWTISTLRDINLGNNNFSGLLSSDFSLASNLRRISVDRNPNLIIDLNTFDALDPSLQLLTLDQDMILGDFDSLSRFTGLTDLRIDSIQYSGDISSIRTPLTNLHELTTLSMKTINLSGNLPNIWANFPSLQRLGLQFNNFIGPLPPSFSSLTGLTSFEISFNHFDGPIPTFFADLSITNQADLSSNCFETTGYSTGFVEFLNSNFQGWSNQYNCRANVSLTGNMLGSGLIAGSCSTYQISYENLGPQIANTLKIGQIFDAPIIVSGSVPGYTTGVVGATYGTMDDPCYADAVSNATGPYYAALDMIIQTTYQVPSLWALAVSGLSFTGVQGTTEFGYTMDLACPFLFGTTDKPFCFLMFGQDMSEVDPSCGTGGTDGYKWNLGNVVYTATGVINVNLCLPAQVTGTISFRSMVTTLSTNENSNSGLQLFNFTINDTGVVDTGYTPPSPAPIRLGGGGIGLRTDIEAGICGLQQEDCSPSYYDGICGVCTSENHNSAPVIKQDLLVNDSGAFAQAIADVTQSLTCTMSRELIESYIFSFDIGLTTVSNICNADMFGPLRRKYLAKFLSVFAVNVLDKKADDTRTCTFTDMGQESSEFKIFTTLSCKLGLMGLKRDGTPDTKFNPNKIVSRAELGAAISRLLYGGVNNTPLNSSNPRYDMHLRSLKRNGIMNDISSSASEALRGQTMLMFKRAYDLLND